MVGLCECLTHRTEVTSSAMASQISISLLVALSTYGAALPLLGPTTVCETTSNHDLVGMSPMGYGMGGYGAIGGPMGYAGMPPMLDPTLGMGLSGAYAGIGGGYPGICGGSLGLVGGFPGLGYGGYGMLGGQGVLPPPGEKTVCETTPSLGGAYPGLVGGFPGLGYGGYGMLGGQGMLPPKAMTVCETTPNMPGYPSFRSPFL